MEHYTRIEWVDFKELKERKGMEEKKYVAVLKRRKLMYLRNVEKRKRNGTDMKENGLFVF